MKIKKAKKHNVPLSHSNLGKDDTKQAAKDPNVYIPKKNDNR